MSGHLCLKWNNHAASFVKSIGSIQSKERYCDATIACQGKYFPVHRIVLSTCSDYFEEIFERIQNQHPYIVFKDIDPREMELLLNYMYQGEVNVLQEHLPTLIKAAEALKIKGLAVPDDLPPGRKRSNTFSDNLQSKRRAEERRKRGDSIDNNDKQSFPSEDCFKHSSESNDIDSANEPKSIKEEPLDTGYEDNNFPLVAAGVSNINEDQALGSSDSDFINFIESENSNYVKNESITQNESFENKSSTWEETSYAMEDQLGGLSSSHTQDDIRNSLVGSGNNLVSEADHNVSVQNDQTVWGSSLAPYSHTPKRAYVCPACPYQNYSKNLILRHMRFKHTGERPFPCTVCPKKFALKTDLKRHMLIHKEEKPYQCQECTMRFRHSNSLKIHLASHL